MLYIYNTHGYRYVSVHMHTYIHYMHVKEPEGPRRPPLNAPLRFAGSKSGFRWLLGRPLGAAAEIMKL